MIKKVNITKDIESRSRIAQGQPVAATAQKPEKAMLQNEQEKTETGSPSDAVATETTGGSDKKSGRKTAGNS